MSHLTINSGKSLRREYSAANRSPLFQDLPERDYAQEQKLSYSKFLHERLPQLLLFYFPAEFSDYNNYIKISIENFFYQEPEITENQARSDSLTWSYLVSFNWKVSWDFHFREIPLVDNDLEKNISQWAEESFKIGKFTCKKKLFTPSESKSLLTQIEKQLAELPSEDKEGEKKTPLAEQLIKKIELLKKGEYQEWVIKEIKGNLKVILAILGKKKGVAAEKIKTKISELEKTLKSNQKVEKELTYQALQVTKFELEEELIELRKKLKQEKDNLEISFHCEQDQKIDFCHLPKMNPQGNFIINGHNKVVVFQSVRAPSVYYFDEKENGFCGEIIPFKGPWISINYSAKKPRAIELKFLNSGLVVDLLDVLKTFAVSPELLKDLFDEESLNTESYQEVKELEVGVISAHGLPQFLFTSNKGNSYFNIGKLGRKKFNQKMDIIEQLKGQTLAEDLRDINDKVLLKKNAICEEKNLQILQNALQKKKIAGVTVPHSTNDLYIIKVKSPRNKEKTISVVGIGEKLPEEKTYFDLADLICSVAGYINLHQGLGRAEKEEDEDKLENQIVRRVGDLVYNIFDNKLGGFLQDIDNKYLAYISQLKKVDLLKIPNLKDFDNLIKHFFNTSALARLQNQNNALSVISDGLVSSVMGLGGRNSTNASLAARNISYSFGGRYDPVETPEGQRIGLVHRLTIGARVNDYGQIIVPYFPVRDGLIIPSLVYLTSEEEKDKYIVHFNIKIDEKNQIMEETVLAIHQENFVRIPKEKLDFIYSSFYHLNSVTSATIPFFQHNDATRMLMATNMQRQAVTLLKSQEPLVASGIEASLLNNSPLVVKAEEKGVVEYVDSQQIVVKEKNKEKKTYELEQLVVSNKNVLNFSLPLVKKGDKVEKGQMIACGNYANNNELSLGYNLRVAYLCWNGYNYEDAIVLSERLVKEDILTSFFVKKHTVIRHNTKYGPEVFTSSFPYSEKKRFPQLDKNGIVKVGSRVKGKDILVGKLTPEPSPRKEAEEELLLMSILGEKAQRFVNSSLRLPAEESGTVYQVKRKKLTKNKNELELVEVYVAQKRKIEIGDKLTTRFGNKGVVAKIVPEADMPFDEEGKTIDIIFNPLGIPTRMNIGQLLETILASAAQKLDTKLLCRPFNSPSPQAIKEIIQEAGIKNYGAQKLFDGQTGLPFQQDVYNGYIYTIKLNHMVADKFHARNIGPYSLIYQQPVKGRSQGGGQRLGEMEIWGLWAHGASFNVNEMTGAKSDDIYRRKSLQSGLLFNDRQIDLRSNQGESLNLLLQNLRGIGFDLQATDYQGREIDFYDAFSRKSSKK